MRWMPRGLPVIGHAPSGTTTSPAGRIGAAKQGYDWARELLNAYRERYRWTVAIDSSDPLYDVAHRWFTDLADAAARPPRNLSARLRTGAKHSSLDTPGGAEPPAEIRTYYDDHAARSVTLAGHRIRVTLERPEVAGSRRREEDGWLSPDTLRFDARTREGQQAVLKVLRDLVSEQGKRPPALYLLNTWGGWTRRDDLPPRSLESVVLPAGQMSRIRGDLVRFLASEADYVRRGQPWHRGYLLEGPPGGGKTSIVRALAAHFGLDLWYAPLGDLAKDVNLLNLIAEVRPRSILLLEDVDVFHATRDRDDTAQGVSMAGLLNALDGVATPHGLISVLTTNVQDVLDPALLRPGRIDLREHIGMADTDQLIQLWALFYGRPPADALNPHGYALGPGMTTADAVGIFQKHPDDPDAALEQLGAR